MNTRKHARFSMPVNLTIILTVELGILYALAIVVIEILEHLNRTIHVSIFVLIILAGLLLGGITTALLSRWIFSPIARLGKAMNQVAKGDFEVRLKEDSMFREIEEINHNFNLMTRELGATEILKTDFVSNVSHEIKTPVSAIEGYATLLQGAADVTEEERQMYVEKILFNTARLSKLVSNILFLSRLDNQAIVAQYTVFSLDEQIRQAILQLEPDWSEKELEFDVEMDNVSYYGPESVMIHIWTNLIGNAIKFSPPKGLISISLTQDRRQIRFAVEDQGPGVPEDAKEHIFDKFYQSDSSHKQEGNGLGLALVKQILAICGGSVSVQNLTPCGCRFTVDLMQDRRKINKS